MLLMKFIFITHPPVRKRRRTVSVLSWAPRIPSPASGYLSLGLEVISLSWLKDYCGPIPPTPLLFSVCASGKVFVFTDISWWFLAHIWTPRNGQKCNFSGSTPQTPCQKLRGWRPAVCACFCSPAMHTHPSTTCTSKPSGDVPAVPAHKSLGTKWGFCVPSVPTSLHVSGGKGLFLICITLTVGHDVACTHST